MDSLSGDAFDKKYLAVMVKDHHKDLRQFRAEEAVAADPNFKSTVENGEKVVKSHTDMADQLAQKNGVHVPTGTHSDTSGQ